MSSARGPWSRTSFAIHLILTIFTTEAVTSISPGMMIASFLNRACHHSHGRTSEPRIARLLVPTLSASSDGVHRETDLPELVRKLNAVLLDFDDVERRLASRIRNGRCVRHGVFQRR